MKIVAVVVLLLSSQLVSVQAVHAKTKHVDNYPECAQRDPSVSEAECEARLNVVVSTWVELKQCHGLYGQEYRNCAVKVPHEAALPVQASVSSNLTPTEAAQAAAAKGATADEIIKVYKEAAAAQGDNQVSQLEKRREYCDSHPVTTESKADGVVACFGLPDHINYDLYTEQWVYGNETYVYIDRQTGKVENIQWTN